MDHSHYQNLKGFRDRAAKDLERKSKKLREEINRWEAAMMNYLNSIPPEEAAKLSEEE
jgi:hypothetical protein